MALPSGIGVIDTMLQIPGEDPRAFYDFMQPLFMDEKSRSYARMPAEHLFRAVPDVPRDGDLVAYTVEKLDAFGIERAMIGVQHDAAREALRRFPERFFGSFHADPNRGMEGVRDLVRAHEAYGIKAVTAFPSGTCPQVPIDDARWYPIYAKCVELDVPICVTVGVPGPRLPMAPQTVDRLDPVCWFFPDLRIVMRHGAEPWVDLAVKLMLKYDNLYYSTSAFAPRHYPPAIVEYANTRGAHKVLYAGYWPMGLSLERIFEELPHVPFREHVWPRFLRENALEVFRP